MSLRSRLFLAGQAQHAIQWVFGIGKQITLTPFFGAGGSVLRIPTAPPFSRKINKNKLKVISKNSRLFLYIFLNLIISSTCGCSFLQALPDSPNGEIDIVRIYKNSNGLNFDYDGSSGGKLLYVYVEKMKENYNSEGYWFYARNPKDGGLDDFNLPIVYGQKFNKNSENSSKDLGPGHYKFGCQAFLCVDKFCSDTKVSFLQGEFIVLDDYSIVDAKELLREKGSE